MSNQLPFIGWLQLYHQFILHAIQTEFFLRLQLILELKQITISFSLKISTSEAMRCTFIHNPSTGAMMHASFARFCPLSWFRLSTSHSRANFIAVFRDAVRQKPPAVWEYHVQRNERMWVDVDTIKFLFDTVHWRRVRCQVQGRTKAARREMK